METSGSGGGAEAHWPDGVCCPDEEVCEVVEGSVCCLRKSSREVPPGSRTGLRDT